MNETTERQIAEDRIDGIKVLLKNAKIDYFYNETPFRIYLQIRKRLLRDNSSKCKADEVLPSDNSPFSLSPTPTPTLSSSLISDSGFVSSTSTYAYGTTFIDLEKKIKTKDEEILKLSDILENKKNESESINNDLINLKHKMSELQRYIQDLEVEKEAATEKTKLDKVATTQPISKSNMFHTMHPWYIGFMCVDNVPHISCVEHYPHQAGKADKYNSTHNLTMLLTQIQLYSTIVLNSHTMLLNSNTILLFSKILHRSLMFNSFVKPF